MQLRFLIPGVAVVAVAGYLWLLGSVGHRPAAAGGPAAARPRSLPVIPDQPAPAVASAQALIDRTQSAAPLIESDAADADPVELAMLLQNGSEQQRCEALREAGAAGITLPMGALLQALRHDRSDRVRAETLDYLAESGGTRRSQMLEALAIAERDPDSAVQARAHEIRRGLDQLAVAGSGAENLQRSASSAGSYR